MPNWCVHDITVSGAELEIFEHMLLAKAVGDDGTLLADKISLLDTFLPLPDALSGTSSPNQHPHSPQEVAAAPTDEVRAELEAANAAHDTLCGELRATYGADNWYEWSTANWGVKWPDRTWKYERRPRSAVISGECPWGPPLRGLLALSAMYPTLRITCEYWEAGMGFAGKAVIKDGAMLRADERSYQGRRGG